MDGEVLQIGLVTIIVIVLLVVITIPIVTTNLMVGQLLELVLVDYFLVANSTINTDAYVW
jgi:uncharacterized membrane protein YczE